MRVSPGVSVALRYLPKAPYVLTIRRGLKELFMTCRGLSKLRTTGMLSQATRTPSARLTVPRATLPKRWAEGIRVPGPLAGGGSTTARGILRLCPASACQTGLPWSSPPA